ncbi:MAG: PaaI family thioesterase [Pseudomonadota bacterium]
MTLAKTPQDLPSLQETLSISGLEFMQRVLSGEISQPPIGGVLNYRAVEVSEGHVVFRGTPEFAHTNPLGTVHGGWYGTLLDSAMACAVMTTVPKGSIYTTLEYKINISRALPIGMEIDAVGMVQHAGRSTGIAVGEIRGREDGKLYATGSTTCLIMQPKGPSG